MKEKDPLEKLTDNYCYHVESLRSRLYRINLKTLERYVAYLDSRKARNICFKLSGRRTYRYHLAREVLEEMGRSLE